jgi:hypothetical protein
MSARTKSRKAAPRDLPGGAAKAFLASGGHLLFGKKLEPYTPSRVVAAQAMGLLYPNIGQGGLSQMKKTGLYPGELKDMLIVLWLCGLRTDAAVDAARLDPETAYFAAEKWGAKAGIVGLCDHANEKFMEALVIFQMIMNEIGDSKTVPATSPRSSSGADGDEEEDDSKT